MANSTITDGIQSEERWGESHMARTIMLPTILTNGREVATTAGPEDHPHRPSISSSTQEPPSKSYVGGPSDSSPGLENGVFTTTISGSVSRQRKRRSQIETIESWFDGM